jgi:hypothetical protein
MRFVSTALVMMAIALMMLAMTFLITPSGDVGGPVVRLDW